MMNQILQSLLRRLTNLSGSNRSILLLRVHAEQAIDLHDFNRALNETSFSIVDALITDQEKAFCPVADSRDESNNKLSFRLQKLQRITQFILEERGSNDLYVGWPFVRGKLHDGSLIRCPLVFFPVKLEVKNNNWTISLRKDVNITLNKSFLLAYAYFNKIQLDDELIERVFETFEKDSRVFRTELYKLFKDSPIDINFNQENFIDKLQPFKNFNKKDFELNEQLGELKLHPEAVLGIFPQSGSHLVPDYIHLIENEHISDIDSFFSTKTDYKIQTEEPEDPRDFFRYLKEIKEEETFAAFKLDAWQENALKAIKKNNSLVIQGPPGTGKSQLICNLITDYAARGKSVLVVCQKKAALNVIYNRLKDVDFQDFAVLVSDFKNDRKSVYDQLLSQIERIDEYQIKNNALDTIYLEREFLQSSRKIDQLSEELEEFRAALFDEKECGYSAKQLYLNSSADKANINLKQSYKYYTREKIDAFLDKLSDYLMYAKTLEKPEHAWYNRNSFAQKTAKDMSELINYINEIQSYNNDLLSRTKKIVGNPIGFLEAENINNKRDQLFQMLDLVNDDLVFKYFTHIIKYPVKETNDLWLANTQRLILECFDGQGPELHLDMDELGVFQHILQKKLDAYKSPLKWFRWQLFSKDKGYVRRILRLNKLKAGRKSLKILAQKIDNRLNLEHNITKLYQADWVKYFPKSRDKSAFNQWFENYKLAVKAKRIFLAFTNFPEYFPLPKLDYTAFRARMENLLALVEDLSDQRQKWEMQMSHLQVNAAIDSDKARSLIEVLKKEFDSICEYDRLKASLEPHDKNCIQLLLNESNSMNFENIKKLFLNSIYLEWINHIETKFPVLRLVSTPKFEKLNKELQENIAKKTKLAADIMLMNAREQTFKNLEYNRLNNRVSYRDLQHQLSKKRRIWPLRKLIKHHHEEIMQLAPCWLSSPESVSAIFQMEQLFDLVIFDEASQCFVEKGIPSVYRAKQLVVVGDKKQLPPNDLYKVRWDEDQLEHIVLETESLLDLADKYLPNTRLQGHYRSKSLELIDFSNKHFYEGKLKMLPDFHHFNNDSPNLKFEKVTGTWHHNQNRVEAEKIIELMLEIWDKKPEKELGVVCFNIQQQSLILDLIEDKKRNNSWPLKTTYFVKNIENVQGDEMDIILFSIAYAPDQNGKLMMQFGSLGVLGGENRLNVAITRAREQVIVVSSIEPDELKVENSKNPGPRLLKEYLQYVKEVSEGSFKAFKRTHRIFENNWFLSHKIKADIQIDEVQLSEDMPFADLSIHLKNKTIGLLLTDDDQYYGAPSAKASHAYLPFMLSGKNWPFRAYFSREFWRDSEQITDQLTHFIHRQIKDY